ncbi:MAG TPA: FAD-dependent oxidoreductase [Verrucomicrobiae bacterium]|nr:FAD-dependent oxidoreductase [Verrucomicrobiae bacterium]
MRTPHPAATLAALLLIASPGHADTVRESAREIPIAAECDVAIAGGTSGAVAAAVAATRSGAKVFLCAPRPYLGEDMTATLRTWLENDETPEHPLAKAIYADPEAGAGGPDPNRIPFTYTTDIPSEAPHLDRKPASLLADGKWDKPNTESVQFDGSVEITIDLDEPQPIDKVRLIAFHRDASEPKIAFKVANMTVFVEENRIWREVARVQNNDPSEGFAVLTVKLGITAERLKVFVEKADDADRILLGEIEVTKPATSPEEPSRHRAPRPLHVKMALDRALLDAGVEFLYASYPTDIIVDAKGKPCGFVISNRAGRQAVLAKILIDATEPALLARLAGASPRTRAKGDRTFCRTVIGGVPTPPEGVKSRAIDPPYVGRHSPDPFTVTEYTLRLPISGADWNARAAADLLARDMTFQTGQQSAAEWLFEVSPDPIRCVATADNSASLPEDIPLDALRPKKTNSILLLGPRADVTPECAARLARPSNLIRLGERVGTAAAEAARGTPAPESPHVRAADGKANVPGDVKELLHGTRPTENCRTIPQPERGLPVLGRYDVVVIGGGTAGAPAGISAARRGSRTLVVEYQHMLGGVGTVGLISKYYWGNRIGFTASIPGEKSWEPEDKAEWYRRELRKAGADIWFGSTGCGALVKDGRVTGAIVATPYGRGVVLAKCVIDTTGNADIAAAAGAKVIDTDETELAVQGTGLPPRWLGQDYTNTDFTIVDETDMLDMWHVFVYSKLKYPAAFDQQPFIDTRERRRIVGEFTLTIRDELLGRSYPDTLFRAYSNFDTHGYTTDPLLEISHPEKVGCYVDVPYRCSLPQGLDGILVGGLGLSAHRDALPLVRMQADLQNQGYGLGVAAALVASSEGGTRDVVIRELQRHLVEIGNLPPEVMEQKDSFPLPQERVDAAVAATATGHPTPENAAVILANPDAALPVLRKAYAEATDPAGKLSLAQSLAILGDTSGLDTLIAEVKSQTAWDGGWRYRGGGQFGEALSHLDKIIIALGRTRDKRAIPAIVEKLQLLTSDSEFSHHRATALALELIGDPSAAPALAEALKKPGIAGQDHATVQKAQAADGASKGGTSSVSTRSDSLRELSLARALYRCGDQDGLGEKTLRTYASDLRGHFARHAQAVLSRK